MRAPTRSRVTVKARTPGISALALLLLLAHLERQAAGLGRGLAEGLAVPGDADGGGATTTAPSMSSLPPDGHDSTPESSDLTTPSPDISSTPPTTTSTPPPTTVTWPTTTASSSAGETTSYWTTVMPMVTITQFNSTRPSPAPPGSTLAPPPSPPTTTASTVTPSLATALPPSHPPTAASVLALALSRSTAPAVSAADAGQRRGSEAAGPAGPLEPVPRASPAPLTSALQPAAAPVPRPAPRTPAAVSAPPPAPTVRGPGAASHAPTPSSRPSSTTPPVTPWPAAASAQWNTPEVEDRLEQLKKEIEGSGTVEVIGILEVDTEAGRPAPWPSTRGPTEPVSTGTPLRVVEELVIVEDAADRFVLEGLELSNDSQPNNQTNCTNDYCVSDDDYISMMEDYLFPTKLEWVLITMHGVVFVSGLVGNALVCVAVYRNHTMRTVTNYFIVNLAVADFLVILLCLPPTVMWDVTETWFMGTALCKIVLYFQVVSVTVSVLTLTFISIDRYYAICYPLKFKSTTSRAKKAIVLIWVLALLFDLPELVVLETQPKELALPVIYFTQCVPSWSTFSDTMFHCIKTLLLFFLPLSFMSVAYYQIVKVLWSKNNIPGHAESKSCHEYSGTACNGSTNGVNSASARRQMNRSISSSSQVIGRRKAAKMLVMVDIMFAICYCPVHTYSILRYATDIPQTEFTTAFAMIAHWMCYFNSAINPLIYNFMSGKFREEFRRAFQQCGCAGGDTVRPSGDGSHRPRHVTINLDSKPTAKTASGRATSTLAATTVSVIDAKT